MTTNSVRAFSLGVIFSTAILSLVYFFTADQKEVEVIKNVIQDYIKSEDLVVLSKQEYEELKSKNDKIEEQSETPPKEPNKKQDEINIYTYTLTIQAGMNSMDIADLLEKENIIENANEFDAYLTDQNLNTSIQIGSFVLNSDMSFQSIADVLTN
ncbi:hypothetical protein PY093_10645 [Cytobacillus sp. S13-E01]|uniref:hypothetical protein n=1 Tax=Cytobacillus sp. S13-E01 TaxID=3031326 RepID=UPI0023D7BE73|nr:hypothetical protein [Cytobacillus sp. S13-E01]MDF0727172.1 hypothetical protein [Cytobacillus sp. S13-E01]